MIDRVDLLIAVIGIVISVLGSTTAMWVAFSKKADRSDLRGLESRVDARFDRVDARFADVDARFDRIDDRFDRIDDRFDRMDDRIGRLDAKFDALILRLVPEVPRTEAG